MIFLQGRNGAVTIGQVDYHLGFLSGPPLGGPSQVERAEQARMERQDAAERTEPAR
ncbi:hypothetical protein [Neomoorella mulderi]|uniref:hypothetical protein n=1 Tax=Neomoorella mulderi TaxID=202604 RepID=UPI000A7C67F5|nr:hypothetical protein [Moorella mulderi]